MSAIKRFVLAAWEEIMLEAFCKLNAWQWYLWYLLDGPQIDETPANKITICRAKFAFYFCSPLYALYLLTGMGAFALASFIIAIGCGAADAADGYYAKKWGCVSESGKCLDPAADGILVVWGGFVPIILEHRFAWEFLIPIVGIVALGCLIFRRRIQTGAPTHMLAKVTMLTIYIGGVACFIAILAKLANNEDVHVISDAIGLSFFQAGLAMMTASTLYYYNVHRLFLERFFRGCSNIS